MQRLSRWRLSVAFFFLITVSLAPFSPARTLNGFDLSDSLIYQGHIMPGGPPKDGIPAIDSPLFETAEQADWLQPDDRVIGVFYNGIARAYPIAILNWHEIVNDRYADQPVVVTYCPLCGSGVVYRSVIDQQELDFGVSGLLYNSDVLLYDRQTDSLWSQLHHRAISGPMKGKVLMPLTASHSRWQDWQERYPDTQVLSRDTGTERDYSRNPYGDYDDSTLLYFPVEFMSQAYHPKERVIGVELKGVARAYPFSELARRGEQGEFNDTLAGTELRIVYDAVARDAQVYLADGQSLPVVNLFWFAWYAFHPGTEVFKVAE
ncbi:MAG: DUF3179 domain-containing protein [Amphritea sp.]|nr:DUF3179 domain-containing protein [Amphritea sp.]